MHTQETNSLFHITKRWISPVFILGITVLLVMAINALCSSPIKKAESAYLDLSQWPERQQTVPIAGDWGILWGEFISPSKIDQIEEKHFLQLPGIWNNKKYGNKKLPAQGKATLYMNIQLPEAGDYSIKVPSLYNSYRLWVNNEPKVLNDSLDSEFFNNDSESKTRIIQFESANGEVEIVFHIANYRHRIGGIWENITLSQQAQENILLSDKAQRDLLVLFCLLFIALTILCVGLVKQHAALIYLSVWGVLMALWLGSINERVLFSAFNIQDWEWQQKIEYLSLYTCIPFFALFFGHLLPKYFPKTLHWVVTGICATFSTLILFTPAAVYSHTIHLFQILVGVYAIFWIRATLDYICAKAAGRWLLFTCSALLIATSINDILVANIIFSDSLINGTNASPYGATIFMISILIFYRNFDLASHQVAVLSSDSKLLESNISNHTPEKRLAQLIENLENNNSSENRKALSLEALQYALSHWEMNGGNKLTLAEKSGLWSVTNDDGNLKTRTLDKYLKEDSFPKKPRYRSVIKTLQFAAKQPDTPQTTAELLSACAASLNRKS